MIAHQRLLGSGRTLCNTNYTQTPRTLGLTTLGFFVFRMEKMIEQDKKKQRDAEFTREHTLTPQDFRKMILEKAERAKVYSQAVRKHETAQEQL